MSTRLRWVVCAALVLTFSTLGEAACAESPTAEAEAEFEKGHYQKACELYRLALATHRTDVSVLLGAAKAYEAAGDLDEAIHRAREAATFERDNASAHFALGHYLDANRDTRAAFMQFAEVIDNKKADPALRKAAYGPLLRLGKVLTDWDKTLKYAKQGAREFKDDADSHYNYAWMLAQVPNRKENEFIKLRSESVIEYRKSIELGEKRPQVHLGLASALADCGDFPSAKIELVRFLKLSPEAKSDDAVIKLQQQIAKGSESKSKEDASKIDVSKLGASKEGASKESASDEAASKERSSKENASEKNASKGTASKKK
ncbi:MAG TPA: hypothetical protein V6C76_06435 [Drouetiella sp.]